jgi:hypothetical protein
MISRRRFLYSIAFVVIILLIGVIGLPHLEKVIRKILEKELSFLDLESGAIDRFLEETKKTGYWNRIFSQQKKYFIIGYYVLSNPLFHLPYQYKYNQQKARIVGDFLLSTSFFYNKMDEKKEVKYNGLYDPYMRPCANPFSDLIY